MASHVVVRAIDSVYTQDVLVLIVCGVVLVALFGALFLIGRRQRGPRYTFRPDPQLVERAFDPALCSYCDERQTNACKACERLLCPEHRPYPAERFCYSCEAEWERGSRRRSLLLTPIVFGTIFLLFGVLAGLAVLLSVITGYENGKAMIFALIAPFVVAPPLYLEIERRWRRRFRRPGIPTATARKA